MKILTDRRLILIAGILFMVFLLTNTLLTESVTKENLEYVEGEFRFFEKKQLKGKVSYSYDIAIGQTNRLYKIAADYTDCFNKKEFVQDVKTGDHIRIGFTVKDGPFRNGSVASVTKDYKDYFDLDCRNLETEESKTTIPIITSIAISVFIGLFVWMTKNKKY